MAMSNFEKYRITSVDNAFKFSGSVPKDFYQIASGGHIYTLVQIFSLQSIFLFHSVYSVYFCLMKSIPEPLALVQLLCVFSWPKLVPCAINCIVYIANVK